MARGEHGDDVHLDVGGRDVRISSPDRVYFPARGETKLDLVNYYLSVGDGIVRALRDGEAWDEGDLLAVDKQLEADHNHIVVAVVDGECTVKRLVCEHGTWWLKPENPDYQPWEIHDAGAVRIWGVVTHVLPAADAVEAEGSEHPEADA